MPCGSSLPTCTCTTSCRPFLLPYPVPTDPSRQHAFTVQMGKLRPGENGTAQAAQQVSSRIRTEIQPGFYSLSPLPAVSASPSSSHAGGSPSPADPAGEAPECPPARVGHKQDPGSHVGIRNSTWQGGSTWLLISALPRILPERPGTTPCPPQGLSFSIRKIYEVKHS